MRASRAILALPLLLATGLASAFASEVRDKAGLFSTEAVKKANADLARIERETNVPVTIETVASLNGRSIDDAMKQLGQSEGIKGLFVLIAAKEHLNEAGASPGYSRYFRRPLYQEMRDAFLPDFKKSNFDAGLEAGIAKIDTTLRAVKAEAGGTITPVPIRNANPAQPTRRNAQVPGAQNPVQGRSGVSSLIVIVVVILAVMIGLRLLGALFGAGRGAQGNGPGGMRGPGGYGAPGYGGGGGGGGFMSSLFGGIGGAMAGNWLYDQFSGRSRHGESGSVPPNQDGAPPAENGGDWGTAGDGGGNWGESGGGGGGDWGTGGGGGGGDWGGGGGGGDWGGGGGGDGGGW